MASRKDEKSALQLRAEDIQRRFKAASRKPIVIEFAGLPKAGKTTTLSQVQAFLKRCGFKTEVVVERASICPIRDKKHSNFNVWTACTTLTQILEHTQSPGREGDPDILILDRGLFDSICWLATMEKLSHLRPKERKSIEQFLLLDDWCNRISGVILMTVSAKEALKREEGYLPVVESEGSIMNEKVLASMRKVIDEVSKTVAPHFRIYRVNTSSKAFDTARKSSAAVANKVLDWIADDLKEDVLTLPQSRAKKEFQGKPCIGAKAAKELAFLFCGSGKYIPKAQAEADMKRVQALPVVVVRNRKGDVLRLLRREREQGKPLDKRYVIWAGGHVRKEDSANGEPLLHCAVRELEEELRLSVECDSLKLKGAIHANVSEGTTKHVAFVYEWRAPTDEVEIVLNNQEFYERIGTSQSGNFISSEALLKAHENGELNEEWSSQIIKNFMNETAGKARLDLFD